MNKYGDEARKVIKLLLGGGHVEETKAMKYVMDKAEFWGKEYIKLVRLYAMVKDDVYEANPKSWSEGSPFMNAYQDLSEETRKAIESES